MTAPILEAAQALVDKLAQVHADPAYQAVWVTHEMRSGPYAGPQYGAELETLIAALDAPASPVEVERLREALLHVRSQLEALEGRTKGDRIRLAELCGFVNRASAQPSRSVEEVERIARRVEASAVRLYGLDPVGRREAAAYMLGRDDAAAVIRSQLVENVDEHLAALSTPAQSGKRMAIHPLYNPGPGCGLTTVADIRASTLSPEGTEAPDLDPANEYPDGRHEEASHRRALSPDTLKALEDAVTLIDEINEKASSRAFNGIGQVLRAKLSTIRATILRASPPPVEAGMVMVDAKELAELRSRMPWAGGQSPFETRSGQVSAAPKDMEEGR